jgi:hypothetical protein
VTDERQLRAALGPAAPQPLLGTVHLPGLPPIEGVPLHAFVMALPRSIFADLQRPDADGTLRTLDPQGRN